MKTHITTLNNMAGTASLAHRRVLKGRRVLAVMKWACLFIL